MFSHTVTIVRMNSDFDFYYTSTGILQDPTYTSLRDAAVQAGTLISESLNISSDGTMLERTVVWDSEESFDAFLSSWQEVKPDYLTEFFTYCQDHGHYQFIVRNQS